MALDYETRVSIFKIPQQTALFSSLLLIGPLENFSEIGASLPYVSPFRMQHALPVPPLKISVLLWNINGKGEAEPRNLLVPRVVKELKPDIILLQEVKCGWVEQITSTSNGIYEKVHACAESKDDSRILFNKEKFTSVTTRGFSTMLKTIIETAVSPNNQRETRSGKIGWQETFKNRISIVGLSRQGYNTTIVFLSFHNAHTGLKNDQRKTSSEEFCHIVSEISKQTGCTVIAGADLNCEIAFGNCNGATVLGYEATKRRRGKETIDHFIVAPPGITGTSPVEALNFIDTRDGDRLHKLMTSLKRKFNYAQYHKALDTGLDKKTLDKKALDKSLDKALDEGLDEGLDEALGKGLDEGLDEALGSLGRGLGKALHKGLHETLQEAVHKALHKDLDKAAGKAVDHDPILLDLTIEFPNTSAEP